jgi:lipooligosaccharide transport system permease protein
MLLGSLLFSGIGLLTAGWVRQIDQVNVPVFLFIVPMFTFCGTYFPRETLPSFLRAIARILPLSSLIDLLRWNLGLPQMWWLEFLWLLVLTVISATLAMRKIYPKLVH